MQRAALTPNPSCRWATGLTFNLPDTLNQLLVPYFTMSRAQLPDSPFAFLDLGFSSVHSRLSRWTPAFSGSLPHS